MVPLSLQKDANREKDEKSDDNKGAGVERNMTNVGLVSDAHCSHTILKQRTV